MMTAFLFLTGFFSNSRFSPTDKNHKVIFTTIQKVHILIWNESSLCFDYAKQSIQVSTLSQCHKGIGERNVEHGQRKCNMCVH